MMINLPDGRTAIGVFQRQSRHNREKMKQFILMSPPPGFKDWADWFSSQNHTEDAEFEIIESKQITNEKPSREQ